MSAAASLVNASGCPVTRGDRSRHLRDAGFRVHEAPSAGEALRLARDTRPDLVLIDAQIADLEVTELCRRIKADPATAGMPVLCLSPASTPEADRRRALQAGADTYLIEPVPPDELIATVSALLRLRRAERALQAAEAQFQQILTHVPAGIFVKDAGGRYQLVNPAFERLTGRPAADLLGRTAAEVFGERTAARFALAERQVRAGGGVVETEERRRLKGGEHTFVTVRFALPGPPLLGGAVGGLVTDVTERRHEETRRRVHHAVTRTLRGATSTEEVAPELLRILCVALGWDLGELWLDGGAGVLGLRGIWHRADVPVGSWVAAARASRFARGQGVPGRVWAAGEVEWTGCRGGAFLREGLAADAGFRTVAAVPVDGAGAHGALVFLSRARRPPDDAVLETTRLAAVRLAEFVAREQAHGALRASEDAYRGLFERTALGRAEAEVPSGRLVRVNRTLAVLTGYPEAALRGATLAMVIHPEDRARAAGLLDRVARGEVEHESLEARYVRHDGTVAWGELVVASLGPEGGRAARALVSLADVTARRRADDERAALLAQAEVARLEAEASSRAKDEWIAALGHEIRNPLAAIRTAVTLLRDPGVGDDALSRLHRIVDRQFRHLTRLLDGLLDVARLASGKIVLRRERVELLDLVHRVVQGAQHLRPDGPPEIAVSGEPLVVHGDVTRLEQVVGNLLDNAIKYTPPGGRITISLERDGDTAVVRVRDTGVGMAPEVVSRLFTPFAQADRPLDRPEGGLGLGLALVRRLAELHGGSATAHSAGPHQGSEFVIRLPLLTGTAGEARPGTTGPSRAQARRVLVVEDNADARESLRILLERWGHRVEVAANGPDGIERIRASLPDVAFIDIGLPGLDGYALARATRALPGGDRVALVALTGYGQRRDERRAREAGFDTFLAKPAEAADLMRVLALRGPAEPAGPAGEAAAGDASEAATG